MILLRDQKRVAFLLICHLMCKRGSVCQSEGLLIPRSSVGFRQKSEIHFPMGLNYLDPQSRVLNYC